MNIKSLIPFLCIPALLVGSEPKLEIDHDLLSQTLGHLLVRGLKQQAGFKFNIDKVIEGIRNEQAGKKAPMTEEEYEQIAFQIQEQQFTLNAEKNLAEATSFLEKNACEKGIFAIDPQLQYRVEKEGAGESVETESAPLIHYKGKLLDGTVFANSADIGEPVVLPIKQSIPGFAKGLVGMKEGEKRTLYIHPELAHGLSMQLPPNSLLIFEVEIVKANAIDLDQIAKQTTKTEPVR